METIPHELIQLGSAVVIVFIVYLCLKLVIPLLPKKGGSGNEEN